MASTLAVPGTGLRYTASAGTDAQRFPVLLLHPWFGCRAFWDRTAEQLAAPTCAVDWYALGDGDWSASSGPEGLAEAAVALLDSIEAPQVDVVGNSVGGIVAQLLAARWPDRVRRLVLVGTGAALGGPPSRFGELVHAWVGGLADRRALAPRLVDALTAERRPHAERDGYVRTVLAADPDFLSAVLVSSRRLDLRRELNRITAPTLVIRGEHDTARSPRHVAELLAGISESRAVEMAGCGHSPMIEQPQRFNDLVEDHLTR
ncbi:3-oxoadipate enol-lactonase [Flexivirga endophytica]|uniref:3-oxoadipate enol-lactonase n=1 Tax=Flexivirga endophytica TaxID=1849103 RepID=A0A916SXD9_9MICO|nr:alpha/beta fold hydrolase [Flexivirga endophytica]GGB18513.1 3-oxoadipate enol-lactonase [Flexivirga endophytica]GHB37166.1 3-oxoadipate enol-lactonase [Flexivirga endophytica]